MITPTENLVVYLPLFNFGWDLSFYIKPFFSLTAFYLLYDKSPEQLKFFFFCTGKLQDSATCFIPLLAPP